MNDHIRITAAEAARVRECVERYLYGFPYPEPNTISAAEDLVNDLGEIYDTALARAIREELER